MKNWEEESWNATCYPSYWLVFCYLGDPSTDVKPNVREFKMYRPNEEEENAKL